MAGNKQAKQDLIHIYGEGCFMERAGIRRVKSPKKSAHKITYHHLKHRADGGISDVENGALLKVENHQYLHSLPREEEEKINNQLRRWKIAVAEVQGNGMLINGYTLHLADFTREEDFITIKLKNNTPEQDKELKRQKFNRAKRKRETRQLIKEAFYEEEEEEL